MIKNITAKTVTLPNVKNIGFSMFFIMLALLLFVSPSFAQQVDMFPKDVVAKVGGEEIIEADLGFAAEDWGQELVNIPAEQQRAFLISVLIDMKVLAQAAKKAKMQNTEAYQIRLNYLENRALRRAYFTDNIGPKITDEAVRKYYSELVADFEPIQEWRARHILVASIDDAQRIINEIKAGKGFENAALEYSSDSMSAQNGGDLGYFRANVMTPPFEEGVKQLGVGQMSEPIKTDFGWHIIKLEDKRMSAPPSFEQMQTQLQQQMLIELFNEEIKQLKDQANIEITDPNIAAQILVQEKANN